MDPQQYLRTLIVNALGSEVLARLELETQLAVASTKLEEAKKEKEGNQDV